jgi:uracil-DNA glycosylase
MDVTMESSWRNQLKEEFNQPYFEELVKFVKSEYAAHPNDIFPKGTEIFKAFEACTFDKVKVVILGQDPYPTKGHAHGLCFSVEPDVHPLPKSLNNIFKELADDVDISDKKNGDLNSWSNQGVLLLNSVLTVRSGEADSHSGKGWEQFTDAVIQKLNQNKSNIVYILWGSKAQKKAANVDAEHNLILKSPHPSPLSSYRGFFGCKHFSKTNAYLIKQGESVIDW